MPAEASAFFVGKQKLHCSFLLRRMKRHHPHQVLAKKDISAFSASILFECVSIASILLKPCWLKGVYQQPLDKLNLAMLYFHCNPYYEINSIYWNKKE